MVSCKVYDMKILIILVCVLSDKIATTKRLKEERDRLDKLEEKLKKKEQRKHNFTAPPSPKRIKTLDATTSKTVKQVLAQGKKSKTDRKSTSSKAAKNTKSASPLTTEAVLKLVETSLQSQMQAFMKTFQMAPVATQSGEKAPMVTLPPLDFDKIKTAKKVGKAMSLPPATPTAKRKADQILPGIPKPLLEIPTYGTDEEWDGEEDRFDSDHSTMLESGSDAHSLHFTDNGGTSDTGQEDLALQIRASDAENFNSEKDDDFDGLFEEQVYSSAEDMPSDEDEDVVKSSPSSKSKITIEPDVKQSWKDVIMEVAATSGFEMEKPAPQLLMSGDSPTRQTQLFQLPPSKLQEGLLDRINTQLHKDMQSKRASSNITQQGYYKAYPRPPKFSNRYMYVNEKWGKEQRICRSHVNSCIDQLFSDSGNKAARSTGHCTLDSHHATLMESAAGWQKHQLAYQEHFIGNARINIKASIQALQDPQEDFAATQAATLVTLKKAQDALAQTAFLTKNLIVPTALYMSTRLEVGRRDSYLDRLNNFVQDDTLIDLRGSKFTNTVAEPTFEAKFLQKARQDIKRKGTRASYVYHTVRGSRQNAKRLDSARGRGRGKSQRRPFKKAAFSQVTSSPASAPRSGRGRGRGGGKPRKPRGGKANKG